MSYIDRVLQPGETVAHSGRLHWVVYAPGWAVLALGAAGLILLPYRGGQGLYLWGSIFVAGIGLGVLVVAWIKRVTTEIAVTNRRFIFKEGFISRRTMEMNLDKIESIDVNQSVLQRLLGYGAVIVRGTGSGLEPLKRIDAPIALRNGVMSAASPAGAPRKD